MVDEDVGACSFNKLGLKFDLTGRACKLLCEEFGEKNVETAMICMPCLLDRRFTPAIESTPP